MFEQIWNEQHTETFDVHLCILMIDEHLTEYVRNKDQQSLIVFLYVIHPVVDDGRLCRVILVHSRRQRENVLVGDMIEERFWKGAEVILEIRTE